MLKLFVTHSNTDIDKDIVRLAISRPTFYLAHIAISVTFVLLMAIIQHVSILGLELDELPLRVFLVPCLVGSVFGTIIAYLRIEQRSLKAQLDSRSTTTHKKPSISSKYQLDKTAGIRIYLLYIIISTLGVFIFASIQMTVALQVELSQLRPYHFAVPIVVGSVFGYLIASNSILQKQLHNSLNVILSHEQALNKEIEERKLIEQTLRHKSEELSNLNKELESYNYTLGHDLRAPIRAIAGYSEILLTDFEEQFNEESAGYLSRIQAAGLHMNKLIEGLLSLTRINVSELSFKSINLSQLANQVIEELKQIHPETNVTVKIQPDIMIQGDQGLMYSVMSNLLGNAWKYSSQVKSPCIEFNSMHNENELITYYVRDNGIGFDAEQKENIFKSFQRLHDKSDYEGMGIGLATVQRIIQRHGGQIWAEATPGQGACFYFTLP